MSWIFMYENKDLAAFIRVVGRISRAASDYPVKSAWRAVVSRDKAVSAKRPLA